MECPVVFGKIVDVKAAHESLDGCKYVSNVDPQFFAFFAVHPEVETWCIGGIKTESAGDGRVLVGLGEEFTHHLLEGMKIVAGAPLLNLHAESHRLADAGY